MSSSQRRRRFWGGGGVLALALGAAMAIMALLVGAAPAAAAPSDPLYVFSPLPPPPPPPGQPLPPYPGPNGYLNGPCGVAVGSTGSFWLSDGYHRSVDVFSSNAGNVQPWQAFEGQPLAAWGQPNPHTRAYDDPCGLALDSTGTLYVNNFHRNVARFGAPVSAATGAVLAGTEEATGVAVDPADDHAYVDLRDQVSEYDSSGAFVRDIGAASLQDGYGIAVSGFPATAGFLYVPDAASETVKVYDPALDPDNPVAQIAGPPGGFSSLRDSALAVDDSSGVIYVLDETQPTDTEEPRGRVDAFSATGAYLGHLKYDVIDGGPSGIAVDNSATATQGRVYLTTGNTHQGGVYAYGPTAATSSTPLASKFHPPLLGNGVLFPTVSIGGPGGGAVECEGDACQILPPEPSDPTLTTLLSGHGNPRPRWRQYYRKGAKHQGKGAKKKGAKHHHRGHKGKARASSVAEAPRAFSAATQAGVGGSVGSASTPSGGTAVPESSSPLSATSASAPNTSSLLLPGASGFGAEAIADGGAPATQAGSHPYALELSLGLDQGGGQADLKGARLTLPPGLLLNPANGTGLLCSEAAFSTPRSTPFAAGSESGESCPDQSQVGTVEVSSGLGGGETKTFGLFNLVPKSGYAARFGAAPFGQPLAFEISIDAQVPGANMSLQATEVPQALQLGGMKLSLWGIPWDASHNTRRGDCLNEAEPDFGWARCSVGEPLQTPPRAFITLPSYCGSNLSFEAVASSWQGEAQSQSAQGAGALQGCAGLEFNELQAGQLSVKKASSASGYAYRFYNEDTEQSDPRGRTQALAKKVTVRLPDGVTLNPSVGAGLGTCSEAQLNGETASNRPASGCPAASKIGVFLVKLPYFEKELRGSIYLASPRDNPFGTLLAVYLVAKSADRGLLFRIPGRLDPNGEGTLTATFDDLPQLPYTDLEVNFRSGQRAPLISPPHCGAAISTLTLSPWSGEVPEKVLTTDSPIEAGSEAGPCPAQGTPPFAPEALSGGVNANVGSYTPYYVKLSRRDTEQEITSYSLILPKGITGKLAGVPFCPEQDIAAARQSSGFAETAHPSCPAASLVGHTYTGYGVGNALTYAPGRIYLAGPYHGAPLSLVTINSATVGPFDLGTIVIRSAFQVDQRTAQLRIDSSASDPIPHIIEGIPLHLREVRIYVDRPQFTHNPSSCEASQLESRLSGSGASFTNPADDSIATVAKHFQLLNCLTLGFKPKLGLRLRGSSKRGGFPSLRATFASRGPRDSNLKRIEVEMPHSLFLAQNHIRTVCTRPQFQAERCPAGSIYGKAVAKTLLFDTPLRGNVYLRSSSTKLPDLVADLHSGAVRIAVEGRIGPGKHGGILAFFDDLPDAPLDSFTMTLRGGRGGLLQNSLDICQNPPLATVSALGQNNIGARFSSVLRGQCAKGKKKGKG
ncbi:MAG: NHL repeat-containing protein [Thermoleophilia bacterium]